MNQVRKRILDTIKPYEDFAKCKDLVVFTIGSDYVNTDYENDGYLETDFDEIIVAVEKEWLFNIMLKDDIENPLEYLQYEYTWDDSYEWFLQAQNDGKIAVIEFN